MTRLPEQKLDSQRLEINHQRPKIKSLLPRIDTKNFQRSKIDSEMPNIHNIPDFSRMMTDYKFLKLRRKGISKFCVSSLAAVRYESQCGKCSKWCLDQELKMIFSKHRKAKPILLFLKL